MSTSSWLNSSLSQGQTHSFRVTYDATPLSSTMDGVSGLSSSSAVAYTSLAAAVRFNTKGNIDARSGSSFTAATPVSFTAGMTYHVILDVNIATHTYNAYVMAGGAQITLGTNLAFRTEQAGTTSLDYVGTLTATGSQTICNIAVAPAIISAPVSATVTAGQVATFSVAATGTATLTYQWSKNGAAIVGAKASSYSTPATAASDSGARFSVVVGNLAGSATSSTAALTVTTPPVLLLNSSVSGLSFGNVTVSNSATQNVTLTNAGNSNVTISQVLVGGAGFNATGVNGIILAPGQSTTITSTFSPAASGAASGSLRVSSNAANSPAVTAMSGTGVAAVKHTVELTWVGAATGVTGFNTYCSVASGGPYLKLTANPVTTASYTDSSVQSGHTYYYVVTALNAANQESGYSSEVSALIQ